jgi:hypothetical protein
LKNKYDDEVIAPDVMSIIGTPNGVSVGFLPICSTGNQSESTTQPCSDYDDNPITSYNVTVCFPSFPSFFIPPKLSSHIIIIFLPASLYVYHSLYILLQNCHLYYYYVFKYYFCRPSNSITTKTIPSPKSKFSMPPAPTAPLTSFSANIALSMLATSWMTLMCIFFPFLSFLLPIYSQPNIPFIFTNLSQPNTQPPSLTAIFNTTNLFAT